MWWKIGVLKVTELRRRSILGISGSEEADAGTLLGVAPAVITFKVFKSIILLPLLDRPLLPLFSGSTSSSSSSKGASNSKTVSRVRPSFIKVRRRMAWMDMERLSRFLGMALKSSISESEESETRVSRAGGGGQRGGEGMVGVSINNASSQRD